jgi:cell wall-associated NlpC family hydrolase
VRRNRLAAATLLALALSLSTVPAAEGDPGGSGDAPAQAFPSQEQVDHAQARAARKARDVGVIKARLLLAGQRLEQAATKAEQASEAYNGALWRLAQAKQKYRAARREAARAQRSVASQRDRIGALVAQSYQEGGDLSALNAMMSAEGPEGVLDQYAGFQGASTSLEADYKRFTAAESIAGVFAAQAKHAKAEQVRLAAAAKDAKDAAVAAAEAAQAEAAAIAEEKDRLIRELARAQNISVQLARERQSALEEISRQRAEERARREALAAARAEARAQERARAQEMARAQAAAGRRATETQPKPAKRHRVTTLSPPSTQAPARRSEPRKHRTRKRVASPAPTFAPPPPPAPPTPPSPHGGAQQAIAYAKAQLGEPYQWGASGPGSWDCSGLTMKAWASAGTYLPHYSVAQYEAGVPITVSELRRGDLVFWSSNGQPSGIHHVAMYIGNGQIIHAPRTGRPVEIDDMYYWVPPDLFVRV